MKTNAIITGTLAGLLLAAAAHAQTAPRLEVGLGALGATPAGGFREQIDGALGVGVSARLRLDAKGHVALRMDADWMSHGWDRRNVELRSPFGGVQPLELRSINTVSFLEAGPELSSSVLGVRPYLGATVGAAYFLTTASGDRKDGGTGFTTVVQQEDYALAYGGQTGVRIPAHLGRHVVDVDLGVRYQRSREAELLRKGDLTVDDSGAIQFSPVRAGAELWIFRAGFSLPIPRPSRPSR